jgi:hypothetical protein
MACTGIEQGRRAAEKPERGQHLVELDGTILFLNAFVEGQAHGNAHPEVLRGFQSSVAVLKEVVRAVTINEGEVFTLNEGKGV